MPGAPPRAAYAETAPTGGPAPDRITVVTVTYGERARFVTRLLERLRTLNIGRVVVVDNASAPASAAALAAQAAAVPPAIALLRQPENLGSAGGYGAGLEAAARENPGGWVWLLDDDNLPEPAALGELVAVWNRYATEPGDEHLALLSLRPDRPYLRRAAAGIALDRAYPRPSSFLGFDWRDLPAKLRARLRPTAARSETAATREAVAIPYGPYGGLFFRLAALRRIGLPDARYFLYGDDNEYTLRWTARGGRLLLVPASVIADQESSWSVERPAAASFARLLQGGTDARVYYAVRNQVANERRHRVRRHWLYLLNRGGYLTGLTAWGLLRGGVARLPLICRAVRDGDRERFVRFAALESDRHSRSPSSD